MTVLPDRERDTVLQTRLVPMVSLDEVRDHAAAVGCLVEWDAVGLLFDEGPQAIVVVLLEGTKVVGALRFCLSGTESVEAIQAYGRDSGLTEVRCWQGYTMSDEQLVDLDKLTAVWQESSDQESSLDTQEVEDFFNQIETETRKRGRGADMTGETRSQVWFDAHGRCMFEGCGADLTVDPVTGQRGNFAYLAHNVASSEGGARGVRYLSSHLSNRPDNILLLCDTHHRILDTVAKADYPATRLSKMRRRFCRDAKRLLDGLSKPPIPAYCVAWPVHQQTISLPSDLQIAEALMPIGARLDGQLNVLSDNEAVLRSAEADSFWRLMPSTIEQVAERILMQSHVKAYRAALFAMGLIPSLIALGAKLGNKCEITPMLRSREHGLWYWPANQPRGEFFGIEGLEGLSNSEHEVCLKLALTASPEIMDTTAETLGYRVVSVVANKDVIGNGALGHPNDGNFFRQRMQELLHELRDSHRVERVHLLPCASNAACVFFGQAFDSHHPELMIYDFDSAKGSMVARLRVRNIGNRCSVDANVGHE